MSEEPEVTGGLPLMRPGPKGGMLRVGGGRPKGSLSIIGGIKKKLAEDPKLYEAFITAIIAQAANGNAQAIRQIVDRLDGPIKEQVESNQTVRVVFGEAEDEEAGGE